MTSTKPLLKWPGGKRRVVPELKKVIPASYSTYYEPFIGGGALFFDLQPENAVISDINPELINLYTVVKNSHQELIEELNHKRFANTEKAFYAVRSMDREDSFSKVSAVTKAARTIYLNKTCFNGLYRVNQKGQFNAPYGFYDKPAILDEKNIEAVSKFLNTGQKTIVQGSYSEVLATVENSDNFIYMDPPYIPLSSSSNFTQYSKEGFSLTAQEELRDEAIRLDSLGNYVLLSNSDTPLTRELYKDFTCVPISVLRSISVKASTRIKTGELVILGNKLASQFPNLKKI